MLRPCSDYLAGHVVLKIVLVIQVESSKVIKTLELSTMGSPIAINDSAGGQLLGLVHILVCLRIKHNNAKKKDKRRGAIHKRKKGRYNYFRR